MCSILLVALNINIQRWSPILLAFDFHIPGYAVHMKDIIESAQTCFPYQGESNVQVIFRNFQGSFKHVAPLSR